MHFQIIDDKLMPSISTIDGLGDKGSRSSGGSGKGWKIPCQVDDFRQAVQK